MKKTILLMTLSSLAFSAVAAPKNAGAIERYPWIRYKGKPLKRNLSKLEMFNGNYPKVLVFRPVEIALRGGVLTKDATGRVTGRDSDSLSYGEFERFCLPMVGINYKVLNEEVVIKPLVFDYAKRFKKDHPEKALILHYNGRARLPRTLPEGRYSNGHWLYRAGSVGSSNLRAESGISRVAVENFDVLAVGRVAKRNPDELTEQMNGIHAVMVALDAQGRPDWAKSEQVSILAGSKEAGELSVLRGCFGDKPQSFAAGKFRIAPHYTIGPFDTPRIYFWAYHFGTTCPVDENGKTASDIYVEELYSYFARGGVCDMFDGIEFDAANNQWHVRADFNNDGETDNGIVDGENVAVTGRRILTQKVRDVLGPEFIVMADARTPMHTRGFDLLNGIESESWPAKKDDDLLRQWSSGINRHLFWDRRLSAPSYHYFNTFNDHPRLTEAAAVMVNAGVTSSFYKDPAGKMHVWSDEMVKGSAMEPGWLGRPLGPAERTARQSPDLLNGRGQKEYRFQPSETMAPTGFQTSDVTVGEIPLQGVKEAFVWLTLSAEPMKTAGGDLPRAVWVTLDGANKRLPEEVRFYKEEKDGRVRKAEQHPFTLEAWADGKETAYGFYYRWVDAESASLRISIEGHGRAVVKNVSVHAAPDVMVRRFEHGAVVANPSLQPVTLQMQNLLGSESYQTIPGTDVGKTLTIAPMDAAFLIKE